MASVQPGVYIMEYSPRIYNTPSADPPPTAQLVQDRWYVRLLWIRQRITLVEKKVKAHGELSLTSEDFASLRRVLEMAAYHTFDAAGVHYAQSKVGIAVRHLRKPALYDTEIAETATKLYERWESGNFEPGPVFGDRDDAEFSSAAESEDDDAVEAAVGRSDLMRGIRITRGPAGGRTYALDPTFPKKEAAVVGANGLQVGDWWPFQICALRDGAHGSRMGGIHGRGDGAYSVVISGAYDDSDTDLGNTVFYSGSRGAPEPGTRKEAVLTNASKSLMMSKTRGRPVRLLRAAKGNSAFAPKVGIRYDGLYRVVDYSQQETSEGIAYWRFTLERLPGQVPIDRQKPSLEDRKEYARMMSKYD